MAPHCATVTLSTFFITPTADRHRHLRRREAGGRVHLQAPRFEPYTRVSQQRPRPPCRRYQDPPGVGGLV